MANNVQITPGSGATITTVDISSFSSYPTTGEVPAGVLYVSTATNVAPAPVTNANPLPVSVQNSTVAVTQSGTWTVAGSGTFTVSAASLPLPTGAATSAKQPALGTAGSASTDVITVQGITSMTPLKTDGSGVTQPVSGTVTANAGTGTFAISASALPLPTGAATSAKQPALGTAGTASTDVLTVQGIASMTALKVDGSAVTQPVSASALPLPTGAATETSLAKLPIAQAASLSTNSQVMVGASTVTITPTYSAGTINPITTDTSGNVRVNVAQRGFSLSNTQDAVAAADVTGLMISAGAQVTPTFALISASSSGDNTIVNGTASKKIRVLRFSLSSNGTVNAKWKSSTAGDITGLMYMTQYGGAGANYCPVGLFETASGENLVLNLSGAVAVGGFITYILV